VSLDIETEGAQARKLHYTGNLEVDAKKANLILTHFLPDGATRTLLEKELKDLKVAELEKAIVEHTSIAIGQVETQPHQSTSQSSPDVRASLRLGIPPGPANASRLPLNWESKLLRRPIRDSSVGNVWSWASTDMRN